MSRVSRPSRTSCSNRPPPRGRRWSLRPATMGPVTVGRKASAPWRRTCPSMIRPASPSCSGSAVPPCRRGRPRWNRSGDERPDGGGGGGGISKSWEAPPGRSTVVCPDSPIRRWSPPPRTTPARGFCSGQAGICREVPDVSAAADPEAGAITVYYNGQWTAEGGTSSAAPLWAAMLIDTESTMACRAAQPTGNRLGFAVPLIYAVAGNPATYAASFNDITTGTNSIVPGTAGLYPATVGYDMASGLGTPRWTGPDGAAGLAAALCSLAGDPGAAPTVSALDPSTVPVVGGKGRSAPVVTVHGTGFADHSGPLVASVTVGGVRLPAGTGVTDPVQVVNAKTLTVEVPPGSRLAPHDSGGSGAGDYQVVVTLVGGASSPPGPQSLLRYVATSGTAPVPAVSSVGPSGGPKSGGTVTVHGSGFTGASRITFGSVPAPTFRVTSDDEMTAAVPAESAATQLRHPDRSDHRRLSGRGGGGRPGWFEHAITPSFPLPGGVRGGCLRRVSRPRRVRLRDGGGGHRVRLPGSPGDHFGDGQGRCGRTAVHQRTGPFRRSLSTAPASTSSGTCGPTSVHGPTPRPLPVSTRSRPDIDQPRPAHPVGSHRSARRHPAPDPAGHRSDTGQPQHR